MCNTFSVAFLEKSIHAQKTYLSQIKVLSSNPSSIAGEKFEMNISIVKTVMSAFLSALMDWICKSGSVQAKPCVFECVFGLCIWVSLFCIRRRGCGESLKHLPCFCVSLTVATVSDCGHQGGR